MHNRMPASPTRSRPDPILSAVLAALPFLNALILKNTGTALRPHPAHTPSVPKLLQGELGQVKTPSVLLGQLHSAMTGEAVPSSSATICGRLRLASGSQRQVRQPATVVTARDPMPALHRQTVGTPLQDTGGNVLGVVTGGLVVGAVVIGSKVTAPAAQRHSMQPSLRTRRSGCHSASQWHVVGTPVHTRGSGGGPSTAPSTSSVSCDATGSCWPSTELVGSASGPDSGLGLGSSWRMDCGLLAWLGCIIGGNTRPLQVQARQPCMSRTTTCVCPGLQAQGCCGKQAPACASASSATATSMARATMTHKPRRLGLQRGWLMVALLAGGLELALYTYRTGRGREASEKRRCGTVVGMLAGKTKP